MPTDTAPLHVDDPAVTVPDKVGDAEKTTFPVPVDPPIPDKILMFPDVLMLMGAVALGGGVYANAGAAKTQHKSKLKILLFIKTSLLSCDDPSYTIPHAS